jgi:hypothetical protein
MNRERELLHWALNAMEDCRMVDVADWDLLDEIRAELAKPEPVVRGWIELKNGILTNRWMTDGLESGRYNLYAVRLDDEQS